MHLYSRKTAGEAMPKDDWEMQNMMKDDKRVQAIAKKV